MDGKSLSQKGLHSKWHSRVPVTLQGTGAADKLASRSVRRGLNPGRDGSLGDKSGHAFAAAIDEAIEGGLLRYSKRLELLKLATELKIDRFQAALIIAEVQYRRGQLGTFTTVDDQAGALGADLGRKSERAELFLKIAALILTAALADMLIVRALFG